LSINGVSINRGLINGVLINRVSMNRLSMIRGGAKKLGHVFRDKSYLLTLTKNGLGYILGDLFRTHLVTLFSKKSASAIRAYH
jgi:hypothetical protein